MTEPQNFNNPLILKSDLASGNYDHIIINNINRCEGSDRGFGNKSNIDGDKADIKSVLVCIPLAIDDVTPCFMELNHKNQINNKRPLLALQEAQKTMLDQSMDPPFTWIGFVIYGC